MQAEPRKFPHAIEIEINSDCNRACGYCPNAKHARVESGRMEERVYAEIVRQLGDLGYAGRVSFHFYNEPLLSPDLDRYVQMMKTRLPRATIELYTNGTLLNEPKLRALLAAGVDRFWVTRQAGDRLSDFEAALAKLEPTQRARVHYESYRELHLTNRGGAVPVGGAAAVTAPCLIPECGMVITVRGNVVACYEDYFQKHVMGNVMIESLAQIWRHPRYSAFRQALKAGRRAEFDVCRNCNNSRVIF